MPRNTMALSPARSAPVRRSTLSMQAHPGRVAFDTVRSRQGRGGEAERAIYVADSRSHVSFGLTRPHASGATRDGRQIQRLVHVPAAADLALAAAPEILGQHWGELGLPLAHRLVAEHEAADQEHLGQVAQAQLVAQAPEYHEGDHVARVLGPVQRAAAALVELLAAGAAAE